MTRNGNLIRRKPVEGLILTQEQFEELHVLLKKTRANSSTVRVNRKAFACLLLDHSTMIERLERLQCK